MSTTWWPYDADLGLLAQVSDLGAVGAAQRPWRDQGGPGRCCEYELVKRQRLYSSFCGEFQGVLAG